MFDQKKKGVLVILTPLFCRWDDDVLRDCVYPQGLKRGSKKLAGTGPKVLDGVDVGLAEGRGGAVGAAAGVALEGFGFAAVHGMFVVTVSDAVCIALVVLCTGMIMCAEGVTW